MSDRTTRSPGCNPSSTSMVFTEARPRLTRVRVACVPPASTLNRLTTLSSCPNTGRPVFGQEESVVSLFRVEAGGTHATRTRVSLGRASVNTIEVLDGLQPGDRVVLSDMSTWDQFDRVRIE